jgi:hypothetical protein
MQAGAHAAISHRYAVRYRTYRGGVQQPQIRGDTGTLVSTQRGRNDGVGRNRRMRRRKAGAGVPGPSLTIAKTICRPLNRHVVCEEG